MQYSLSALLRARALAISLALVSVLLPAPASGAASAAGASTETWMGIYLGDQKVGHLCVTQEQADLRGRKLTRTRTISETEMSVLGSKLSQSISTTIYSDEKTHPVYEEFKMSSGGKTTEVFAEFEPAQIAVRLVTATGESKKTIPVPDGKPLVGDTYSPSPSEKLTVGNSYERRAFNPLTLTLDQHSVRIDRSETLKHQGRDVKALVMVTRTPLSEIVTWLSEKDNALLRVAAPMGITMVRETRDEALGRASGQAPPPDFAVVTSIPANMDLPEDRQVKRLHIKLDGLPGPAYIFDDQRQQVQDKATDGASVTYLIRAIAPSTAKASLRTDLFPSLSAELSDAPYLSVGYDKIKKAASDALGSEQDLLRSAEILRKWVHSRMKPDSTMGVLRPATDIIDSPTGVCRDYAILYAALARSAGIPTRLVAGLVYSRGALCYHAWNEVWSGSEWVAVDSTLKEQVVDATHIKLVQGDPSDMFRLAGMIGKLNAEIISFD